MNKQEIFNKVATHLLKQNKKSLNGVGTCAYRGGDGLKCAIGCLIPDEAYSSDLEGCGILRVVRALRDLGPMSAAGRARLVTILDSAIGASLVADNRDVLFLDELQGVHDDCVPGHWGIHLRSLAKRHQLEMPCDTPEGTPA